MKKKILFGVWFLLAVLCAIYGMIVRAAGSGTSFFAVWIGLAIVFGLFAFVVKKELWSKLPGVLRNIFTILVCIGIICLAVVEGGIISKFNEAGEADLDYIIVLGAQVYENGPSRVLKFRLDRAIEYLDDNPETICIVSGGQGYNEPFAEAVGMAEYLEENGILEERIIQETKSNRTEQNISNSMVFIEDGATVGVVTNNFHVFRALQIAKSVGLENVSGIAADTTKLYLPNNMLREFFGEIKFLIKKVI